MLRFSFTLLLAFCLLSCRSEKEQVHTNPLPERKMVHLPDSSDWRKMKCGLYMSPEGKMGYASHEEIANLSKPEIAARFKKKEVCPNRFLTTFGHEYKISLNEVIDTSTFKAIGAGYFKDKNHIYSHYGMCDGGYFNIFSSDTSSFRLLNQYYATYKNEIYYYRADKINADFKTFKVSDEFEMIAKDKHGFFEFGERVTEEELIESTQSKEAVRKLKSL